MASDARKENALTVEELKKILKNLKTDEDKQYVDEISVYYKNVPAEFFTENKEYVESRQQEIKKMLRKQLAERF